MPVILLSTKLIFLHHGLSTDWSQKWFLRSFPRPHSLEKRDIAAYPKSIIKLSERALKGTRNSIRITKSTLTPLPVILLVTIKYSHMCLSPCWLQKRFLTPLPFILLITNLFITPMAFILLITKLIFHTLACQLIRHKIDFSHLGLSSCDNHKIDFSHHGILYYWSQNWFVTHRYINLGYQKLPIIKLAGTLVPPPNQSKLASEREMKGAGNSIRVDFLVGISGPLFIYRNQ